MTIEIYIVVTVLGVLALALKLVRLMAKVKSMQEAMDDLGKSRTISSDAIARLDELEASLNKLEGELGALRDALEKNARLSRLAISQVDPLRRNLQELQAALAHANSRRPRNRFTPNA